MLSISGQGSRQVKFLFTLIFICLVIIILSHFIHFSAILPSTLLVIFSYFFYRVHNNMNLLQQGQVRTMRALLQQEPPLSQTVDYSREPLLVLNRKHQIMDVSPQVRKLLSIPESSLLGQSIFSILPLPKAELDVWRNSKGEITYQGKNEGPLHFSYCIRPLIDQGQRTGRLIILSDISEEKKREETYLQAAKFSVIGQVAAGLAHELRNPLTTIKGFMQLIGPDQFPENFRPYHQLILDEIQTTHDLIRNFLLLTNPSAPQFNTIEPESLIQKAIQILQPTLLMREVTISFSIVKPIPFLLGDEEQLLQALLSIIQNSIEASPMHGQIQIRLMGQEDSVELNITDQGDGIPDNIRERVFDPFFSTRKERIGLGLTIAQRIIFAHHGELSIINLTQEKGTSILLHLPVQNTKAEMSA